MSVTINPSVTAQLQSLSPSSIIELFELDLSSLRGPVVHYHAGTNGVYQPIVWQGVTYFPFPVKASGFEYNGQGQLPRPKLQVSNITGAISALVLTYGDLLGAKVTRRRTLAQFLDAVNFTAGNPEADPTAEFPLDIYFIEQRTAENRNMVEFQLAAAFDFQGITLPRRRIVQNVCVWQYRVWDAQANAFDYDNATCPYNGGAYFDANDNPTSWPNDVCGKRLSSCKARYGQNGVLPFGSFPACGINNT